MEKQTKYIALVAVVVFFSLPFLFASCGNNDKVAVSIDYESGNIPTVGTDSVEVHISDSGIVRYKVIAQTWNVYEQVAEKYSHFPDGLYLEHFDTLFNVMLSVKADSAWNFAAKKIWKLKGNVFIKNYENQLTYESDEFYWDEQNRKIYSDSVVKIQEPGQLLVHAKKFVSDDRLEEASFVKIGRLSQGTTLIVVNEDEENSEDDDE